MSTSNIPAGPPPPYPGAETSGPSVQHKTRNGIPPSARRSMEDEHRPLPKGWVRQFDHQTKHQFFVDTTKEPPRAIWTHPYDDQTYLSSLPAEERERVLGMHRVPSQADIEAESTDEDDDDDDDDSHHGRAAAAGSHAGKSKAPAGGEDHKEKKLGRRLKDKLTGTTHTEREAKRKRRAEEERRAYAMHSAMRNAMAEAMQTGQPVRAMRDSEGHDIYVEPPNGYARPLQAGAPAPNGRSVNLYGGNPYNDPNARFIRPQAPYQRGIYGGGYGGYGGYGRYGYGGGLGLPLAGGLAGGLLLGGLLF